MLARSFQAKLLYFMVAGLVLLQAATLAAVHVSGRRALHTRLADELRVGARVLDRILEGRGRQLSETVRVMAADFAFREAIASEDRPTITSVLQNHGARMGTDAVFLISLDGSVAADTREGRQVGRPFPYPALVARALPRGEAAAVVAFDDRPHLFVIVPVLAPQPIALVCIGFVVDETLLGEVSRLTGLDVSVWIPAAGKRSLVSTLSPPLQSALLDQWERLSPSAKDPLQGSLRLGTTTYEAQLQPLAAADEGSIHVLLQRSVEAAWEPFRQLELQIFLLSSAALLAALVAAMFLARGVSRPVHALAEGAQRIERGDYATPVAVDRDDEIGRLATALDRMRAGIGEREERIRHQATHDSLTGLPNRTLFLDRLGHAIEGAKRHRNLVGMLMMDVDRFKEINDTLGHEFGDDLLVEIARRLRKTTRESDTVARLGGDEFALMFETEDASRAVDIAGRTGRALESAFALGGVSIDVKASMGIALYPLHAEDAGTLMKRADVAMYDAKRSHQPFALYEAVRDEHSLRRLAILSELRHAVASDQIEVHYQPKIDFATGRTVHAEALARWRHAVHGMLPPDEFIPLAEQSGNIGMITKCVLRKAIEDCARWRGAGHELAVAVNLSALDLYDPELPTLVNGFLHDRGLPPSRLVLEITESAVMKDPVHAARTLRDLKDRGISLAIDDFGTGYSSLAHLKRLPVDELKIDKSFVVNLDGASTEDGVIVRSTIELGHNMGLKVIAEGVESAEGWKLLATFGCDMAQGYYISRPLRQEEFLAWLKESRWGSGGGSERA
ncbi:MAG TPA: EAL domain-containing protein [Vicinamibacteria bacterium]|nr:EAL domain-containing protein [Vicinamibacteria bacterium]